MEKCKRIQFELINNHKYYYREFPWRKLKDPYYIMLAEFMLHRTKAEQIVKIYEQFIEKYPNVFTLASAEENEVKLVTEHLGLHWRSRHFIEASKFIVDNFAGILPRERKELLRIPGIGDYVAGAILTVCFNKPEYVIDSNIARFINRFLGLNLSGEIRRNKGIIILAKELFNYEKSGDLLFALLDFTAIICKPIKPKCNQCIFATECYYA